MAPIFNWPPFKLVELNADTGKPTDPNIGMRVRREFYDVKRDGRGKKVIVAHKTGGGSSKQEDTKEPVKNEGSEQNKVDGERKEKNGEGGGNQPKQPKGEWTAEEDEKLKAMKADGKTMKEIKAAFDRSEKQMTQRWTEICEEEAAAPKDVIDKPKASDVKTEGADGAKAENRTRKAARRRAPSKASSTGEVRFTLRECMTLQEDDLFSFGELQCLSELTIRDESQRWLRIAAAFFDKTGRRVHPDDIRDKFMELASVRG